MCEGEKTISPIKLDTLESLDIKDWILEDLSGLGRSTNRHMPASMYGRFFFKQEADFDVPYHESLATGLCLEKI